MMSLSMESGSGRGGGPGTETTPRFTRSMAAPRLVFRIEREAGRAVSRSVEPAIADVLRIGSHDANEIVLSDPTVSRFHCKIERGARAWRLVDQGSTNGTRVGGVAL